MGVGPVAFSYDGWIGLFPEFTGISVGAAAGYFNLAQLYVRNDGGGPVNDINMLTSLLNLTTAHLAALFSAQTFGVPTTGGTEPAPPLVGRINNASEGSVSVATEMPDQPPNAAWWNQTKYGAAAWAAMKPYRTFRYLGSVKNRRYNPPARYWGWGI